MKIRDGFVSNSSSSSFLVDTSKAKFYNKEEFINYLGEHVNHKNDTIFVFDKVLFIGKELNLGVDAFLMSTRLLSLVWHYKERFLRYAEVGGFYVGDIKFEEDYNREGYHMYVDDDSDPEDISSFIENYLLNHHYDFEEHLILPYRMTAIYKVKLNRPYIGDYITIRKNGVFYYKQLTEKDTLYLRHHSADDNVEYYDSLTILDGPKCNLEGDYDIIYIEGALSKEENMDIFINERREVRL